VEGDDEILSSWNDDSGQEPQQPKPLTASSKSMSDVDKELGAILFCVCVFHFVVHHVDHSRTVLLGCLQHL
jgi:hypothetical protein